MDDFYTVVRSIYFIWSFLLFLYMVYWGLQDLLLGRKCGHVQVPPEHYLFATASLAGCMTLFLSLGEIFLDDIMGGFRVFLPIIFLLPATIAAAQGAFRIRMHRVSIRMGTCGGSKK